ncbi:MAG: hypothetical protein QGH40_11165, partial [bacterium]|nr:hypothetical protein [bacterium]
IYLLAADDKVMAVDIKDKTNRKIDTLTGIGVGLVGTSSTTGLRIKNLSSNSYGDIAEASITVQTVKGSFNFEWEFDDTNYTALTDGVWYWRVKPVDEAGNQGSSEWWSYDNKFTIDTAAPEPPVIDSPQNGQMITATTIDVLISLLGSDASQVKVYGVNTVAAGNVSSSSIDEANLIGGPVDVPVGATTVTITVELSPIDGTKTIAATAIDKAGNVSEPSVPVSFILDRTDPKINQLVIQSYNPGSGSVTDPDWSGKLLVIVEYSEEMDSSTEPTVTVTPDNGSGEGLTAIGMASLGLGAKSWSDTGTTWTGMVRIPKGPGYDGLATVTVGGQCKDLAGKVARSRMFPGYFSIDTAPRFTIRIFYNPADERDVIIGLEASEPLRLTPSCQVTVAGQKFDIMMNHISQYMYTGVHRLTTNQVGRLDVQVFGTDLAGNTGEQTKSFTLGRITVFKGGVLASADGKLEIAVPAGAVEEDKLVAFLPAFETTNEAAALKQFGHTAAKQSSSIKSAARQGLVMAGPAHNLGPSTVEFIDSYTAKGHLDNEQQGEILPIDKIGVYLFSGGVWNYLGAIREDENTIAAKGRGTGLLALMADLRKPEVAQTYPDEGEAMDTAQSQIEVWIDESGSGVDPASIKVMINGRKVKHSFETAGNHISFKPAHPLAEGDHELAVELSDKAGNSLGKVLVPLQSPGQFRFDSLKNYPNPVNPQMNDVTISYIFNQNTSRIDIDIFDITGDLVRSFQDATQPAAAGVVGDEDWDCTNDFGEAVANGVYIYRIKAINAAGDSSSERTGKIAVLR